MKDPEENINYKEDKSSEIETGLESILEIVLDIDKTGMEGYQEDQFGLETNLEIIQVMNQMIEQDMVEMILNSNLTNTVNIVIKMVMHGNIVGRCKPMQRKQEVLRRWMIEMMTHQTH